MLEIDRGRFELRPEPGIFPPLAIERTGENY
jgi:hypothetical protein